MCVVVLEEVHNSTENSVLANYMKGRGLSQEQLITTGL